jgi:hypothetical protein
MATKPALPITELDFFRVKNQLKNYLRNETSGRFQDIDFEGSNMSVLLDVLAYNTYQNNFYTNMAISEMFLDSAQLENSVVSHAKELNYLPRSVISAKAVVNISIHDPQNTDSTIVIPEKTQFFARNGSLRYNFYTNQTYIARRVGTNYIAENIEIFEGEPVEEAFFVTGNRRSIRLLNKNIDISSIKVFENFEQPLDRIEYVYRRDIFGVESDDPVFYIEPSFDQTYEVLFGNNRFGRVPPQNSQIRVFYRIANGEEANGACDFRTTFRPNVKVTTVTNAFGGAERESLRDIKFFAPRSIQVQERAVTERDYEILLKQRYSEIQDISVFGGDELNPPKFGKVAIAVNIEGGLSEVTKTRFENFMKDKTPVGIQPIFIPPEFMYIELVVEVTYSSKLSTQSKEELEKDIRELLKDYNKVNLNKFGSVFELSRVSALIDSLSPSIINNTLDAMPYILYSPSFQLKQNPTFNFGSSLESPCRFARANKTESYKNYIRSSNFKFEGVNVIIEDNGLGAINVLNTRNRSLGQIEIVRRNAGTVDYETGIVKLSDFIIDSYEGAGVKILANTKEKNVSSPKQSVLILNDSDVQVIVKEIR